MFGDGVVKYGTRGVEGAGWVSELSAWGGVLKHCWGGGGDK